MSVVYSILFYENFMYFLIFKCWSVMEIKYNYLIEKNGILNYKLKSKYFVDFITCSSNWVNSYGSNKPPLIWRLSWDIFCAMAMGYYVINKL